MTSFAPVREAYRLWLLTAPQLTLEVDDLTSLPGATISPWAPATNGCGRAPGSTINNNGPGGAPVRASASGARR